MNIARRFNGLLLPKLFREMDLHIFSLRSRRQNKAWGGALQRGAPGTWPKYTSSPRSGRQLFVIRHFIIILRSRQWLSPAAAGLRNESSSYLGLRLRSTPGFTLTPAIAG
jgi:hypothetical protein